MKSTIPKTRYEKLVCILARVKYDLMPKVFNIKCTDGHFLLRLYHWRFLLTWVWPAGW